LKIEEGEPTSPEDREDLVQRNAQAIKSDLEGLKTSWRRKDDEADKKGDGDTKKRHRQVSI